MLHTGIVANISRYINKHDSIRCVRDFCKNHSIVEKETYYPECSHKNSVQIKDDLITWAKKYSEFNKFYYLYGFDAIELERDMDSYQDYSGFLKMRSETNLNGRNTSQVVLLRDKYLFFKYLNMYHITVPEVYGAQINNKLVDSNLFPVRRGGFDNISSCFVKPIDGECGEGVTFISNNDDLHLYLNENKEDCIFQQPVIQHSSMALLNQNAVNTIRMVTVIKKNGEQEVFGSILRIGTKDSKERDNTSQGGIAVGIKENGTLLEYGFRKPEFGGRIKSHPDTGVVFSGFQVPYYEEAVEAAFQAHRLFYRVRSIGWDIAITPNGPIFIEGNDDWELQTFQGIFGGLRDRCNRLLK